MSESSPVCTFGSPAPEFDLPGTDGKRYRLGDVRGKNGLVVMFICNHCPYVKAVRTRLVRDCAELLQHGIGSIAISSNDVADYPEDSFDIMRQVAEQFAFPFPYVWDESQATAMAYGAVCTPDFFGFNAGLELQYRGRLDSSGKSESAGARRELFEAMLQIGKTGRGPTEQIPSIGCSIKWKRDA
ncbi:MAG: thioredoxin family protein [Burkholderiales bacterium]|nr:thioredoxin family protein [Burkholderiales bacterium]MDQ3195417.1 thioredoxin family protein [Pseudomonadota bacterium]